MKPATVVVSLPVLSTDRSLQFYRALGLEPSEIDDSALLFELPNLSLFLIEHGEYSVYAQRAGIAQQDRPIASSCILSCAIGSTKEVDDILAQAAARGGSAPGPAGDVDGSYTGYFSDPDGHVWELVCNTQTEAAAARE